MTNEFQRRFGARLRQKRLKQGLSQAELAERIGWVKPGSISQWETGRALPRVDHLHRLAQELWCSVDWLLGSEREGQTEVEEGAGLRWRISQPRSNDLSYKQLLEDGIRLVRMSISENLTFPYVRLQKPFSGLTAAYLERMLDAVLLSRIVELVDVDRDTVAEQRLKEKFDCLLNCIVSDVRVTMEPQLESRIRTEAVAFLAARDAIVQLSPQASFALTGGSPVSRMVDLIPAALPQLVGTSCFPLLRSNLPPTAKTDHNSANGVIARLVWRQPGLRGYRLPFVSLEQRNPEYTQTIREPELSMLQHARWVMENTLDCMAAFLSVHSSEYGHRLTDALDGLPDLRAVLDRISEKERQRYIGNILLYLIDEDGNRIGNATDQQINDEIVYSIGLGGLRKVSHRGNVWILAEVAHKAPVVRAALVAGLANCLVIDKTVAQILLLS